MPVAIVVGAEDGLTPLSEAEAMVAALNRDPAGPSAVTLTVVPAAGHLAAIEQPEPVARAVAALWASSGWA
jgi:pimeloyl-ACP methyl ester carboxylesterase